MTSGRCRRIRTCPTRFARWRPSDIKRKPKRKSRASESVKRASEQSEAITELLQNSKTIAVVGLSASPMRPSHGVSAYMQSEGFRIIPVNPEIKGALGEKAYASLEEISERVDVVNIFRRSEFVPPLVDAAIKLKPKAIWMQEGVVHEAAAEKARKAGILVIMDRCILKEHKARFH